MDQPPAEGAPSPASGDSWRIELTPWLWLLGLEGDVVVRGLRGDVSSSFIDIIDESDSLLAIPGRVEIGYGRVAGFVDGSYASIGVDEASGPVGVGAIRVDIQQAIVDFGLMYRLAEWGGPDDAGGRAIALDAYAGGRFANFDISLTPALLAERSQSRSWVDPMVGLRLTAPFAEQWHLKINGDVGGFGAASDLTWSVTGVVGFDFHISTVPASVYMGYRAIGWDYSHGSGSDEFAWDMVEHGIILGFSVRF